MTKPGQLVLTISTARAFRVLTQLFEQGFFVDAPTGCSVRHFIGHHLGIENSYLEERIQTIFLDHNPVDDIDTAVIGNSSVLALSAAMPGLAGATLRKGGRFATLRNQISRQVADEYLTEKLTTVTVKFFNMVAKEQGPLLLKRGVRILGANIAWLFDKHADRLFPEIQSAQLEGNDIDLDKLADMKWPAEIILKTKGVKSSIDL